MADRNRRPPAKASNNKQQLTDKPKQNSHRKPTFIKVRVLRPILRPHGGCLKRGDIVDMVKDTAEIRLAKGAVELYTDTPLVDAIRAVQDAGGRIDYKADNAQMIKAFAELEAEQAKDKGVADEVAPPAEPKAESQVAIATGEKPAKTRKKAAKRHDQISGRKPA